MTPHASAASASPREPPIQRRLSFRRSLRESGLPDDYLEALDAKRRQLDDSIWKYIASKEREYKNYERELRHQRRASQGQDGEQPTSNGPRKRKEKTGGNSPPGDSSAVVDSPLDRSEWDPRETMERTSIAGLKDRRASFERDKEFEGVFTPSYLHALSEQSHDTGPATLERTASNPEELLRGQPPNELSPGHIERTNSDSLVLTHGKKPTRPSQLVLAHRTSSSGSSADGKLASAMKSPTQRPKRKRVSLAVGDAIVAPSDNVPVSLSHHSTPSHSRIRQAATSIPTELPPSSSYEDTPLSQTTSVAAALMQAEETAVANARSQGENETSPYSPSVIAKNDFATVPGAMSSTATSKMDADGDLFDLEQEEDTALPPPILDSDDQDEDAIEDDDSITGRMDSTKSSTTSNPISTPSPGERYDPTNGIIPEPEDKPDSAVPYLASSAQTSQMPSKPGFRRPSVVHDPVFQGPGYAAQEQKAVDEETYGSSYIRPSTKGSFTSGSLGESFMEMNAEMMSRLREERQQRTAQVRS